MVKCPGCGEDNPPKFRLCGYCGTPLAAVPVAALPAHDVRKTVTIVFTDLKDSTSLGEKLDPEALHEVKERYFSAMAAEITRHGGKIEKYIGDAIMAVFGLPVQHEDDALRAVRAAAGMREALRTVNRELAARYGVELANFRRTLYRSLVGFPFDEDPEVANTPIPDLATVESRIEVPDAGLVTRVRVTLDIEHTFDSDLRAL